MGGLLSRCRSWVGLGGGCAGVVLEAVPCVSSSVGSAVAVGSEAASGWYPPRMRWRRSAVVRQGVPSFGRRGISGLVLGAAWQIGTEDQQEWLRPGLFLP